MIQFDLVVSLGYLHCEVWSGAIICMISHYYMSVEKHFYVAIACSFVV